MLTARVTAYVSLIDGRDSSSTVQDVDRSGGGDYDTAPRRRKGDLAMVWSIRSIVVETVHDAGATNAGTGAVEIVPAVRVDTTATRARRTIHGKSAQSVSPLRK